MARISINFIKTLKYTSGTVREWDDTLKGFGVRIQPHSMSYFISYRNQYKQKKYYTIGKVGVLTPDEARRIAKEKLAAVIKNEDPAQERRLDKNTMSVSELCDWYLNTQTHNKKPSTVYCNKNSIEHHIKPLIGLVPIKAVNRAIIENMVYDIQSGDKIYKKAKTKSRSNDLLFLLILKSPIICRHFRHPLLFEPMLSAINLAVNCGFFKSME